MPKFRVDNETGKYERPPEEARILPFLQKNSGDMLQELAEISTEETNLDLVEYVKKLNSRDKKKRPLPLSELKVEKQVPDHDVTHLRRVVANGNIIVEKDFANEPHTKRIVDAILKLHDIITHPKNSRFYATEAKEAADYSVNLLRVCDYEEDEIIEITRGIEQISYVRDLPPETAEAQISFDADKIDQFGAIGFFRYYATGGQIGRPFFHSKDPLGKNKRRKLKAFESTLDARLERIPEILKMMFTQTGKSIAARRAEFEQKEILPEIEKEIEENHGIIGHAWTTESGVMLIMRALDQAGKNNKTFYNLDDPFAEKERQLDPQNYPLDELIIASRNGIAKTAPPEIGQRRQKFLKSFLEELKLELAGK